MQDAVEVSAEAQGGGFSARDHRADPGGGVADGAAALDAAGVGKQYQNGGAAAADLVLPIWRFGVAAWM